MEEEQQIVKTFIQKWIKSLFSKSIYMNVDGDQKRILYELFQINHWRSMFLQCLLEKSNEKIVLHQWNFELLVDMIRTILEEANKGNNFQFLSIILQLISKCFTLQFNGLSVFLQDYLIDLDIWNNVNFWKMIFFEMVEKHNQYLNNSLTEKDIQYKILKNFIYYMIILKVNEKLIFTWMMGICSNMHLNVQETVLNSLIKDMENITLITEQIGDKYDQRKNFFTSVIHKQNYDSNFKESLYYQITNTNSDIFSNNVYNPFLITKKYSQFKIIKEIKKKYSIISCEMISSVKSMQYHYILKVIICGTQDGQIIIYDSENKIPVASFHNCKSAISCLAIDEKVPFFVCGSWDNTVRVWNVKEDGRWFQQNLFYDHIQQVNCIALQSNYIVSGSDDKYLKVFDLQSNVCISTLNGHYEHVSCVHIQNNSQQILTYIVSGAYDGSICVWDSRTWKAVHTFNEHSEIISQIQFINNKIVSASNDNSLKMWNITSGKCEYTLIGHDSIVNCFQYSDNTLVSGSDDKTLKVWDFETGTCLQTMNGHTEDIKCLKIFDDKAISGSYDKSIKIWNIKTGTCITTLVGHNDYVNNVEIKENSIVSSSLDHSLKFWEFEDRNFNLNSE